MNSIATPKDYIVRCRREEMIAKSQPYEQKLNTKAHLADKLNKSNKLPNATVTQVCGLRG